MEYYIETGALRILNKDLHLLKEDCFTSAWSIFELMSELTKSEKEFRIRKSVITNIINSNFRVTWSSPDELKAKAFPSIKYRDFRFEGLRDLVDEFLKYSNFETFLSDTSSKKYNYSFFNELDKKYVEQFINGGISGNEKIKTIIADGIPIFGEDYKNEVKLFLENLYLNESDYNENLTLFSMFEGLIDGLELELKLNLNDSQKAKIFASYDNSLNVFLKQYSFYSGKKMAEFKVPAKNDVLDLLHLMYLEDGNQKIIVSDDKLLLEAKNHCISVNNFKELYIEQ